MRAVVVVTERFVGLAETTRRTEGVPDAPMIVLPRSEAIEYAGPEAMESAADFTLREALGHLVEAVEP